VCVCVCVSPHEFSLIHLAIYYFSLTDGKFTRRSATAHQFHCFFTSIKVSPTNSSRLNATSIPRVSTMRHMLTTSKTSTLPLSYCSLTSHRSVRLLYMTYCDARLPWRLSACRPADDPIGLTAQVVFRLFHISNSNPRRTKKKQTVLSVRIKFTDKLPLRSLSKNYNTRREPID